MNLGSYIIKTFFHDHDAIKLDSDTCTIYLTNEANEQFEMLMYTQKSSEFTFRLKIVFINVPIDLQGH